MENSSFEGVGWSFPPTFDLGNRQLKLVSSTEAINQSIDIILSTAKGERSLLPDFGSDLSSFLFKQADQSLVGDIVRAVRSSLLDYEPRIVVNQVDVSFSEGAEQIVNIAITYTKIKTNTRHNHIYPFSIKEGTNLQVRRDVKQ